MGADQLDDLVHAREPAGQGRPQRPERPLVAEPHSVAPFVSAVLGGDESGAGELGVGPELPEHLLGVGRLGVQRLSHPSGELPREVQLHLGPDRGLLHDVGEPAGRHGPVVRVGVAVEEYAVPRHYHVIEDDDGVLLVEPAGEWVVEGVARGREAVAAEELHARRRHRKGERQRVAGGVLGDGLAGVDEHLVGEGGQRGQGAGTAHDDPVRRLAHLVEHDLAVAGVHVGQGLVDGGVDDGVGHRPVVEHGLPLEAHQVGGPLLVAVAGPHVATAGEAGHGDVEVVRTAPQQPEGGPGRALQRHVSASQVAGRAGDDVADVDQVAGRLVDHQERLGLLVLQVVQRGHRLRRSGQRRVGGDVFDAPAVEPDLASVRQPVEELLAGPRSHSVSSG